MAQVPYSGIPEAQAEVRGPDVTQRIPVTADAFGSTVGKGLEELGAGATKASEFFGQVAADDAFNTFQDRANRILYGDPNQTTAGSDGQPQRDMGFLGTKGREALDRWQGTEKSIDDAMRQVRDGLQTPEQQHLFDQYSRRYRSYTRAQIGRHADTQTNTYYSNVNTASGSLALTHIANNADDPEAVAAGASDLINARVKQAQLVGAQPGDEIWTSAVDGAKRDALKAQLEAVAVKDPARAMRMLEKNRSVAGSNYDELATKFRSRADWQIGREAGMQARNPVGDTKTPDEVADHVLTQDHTRATGPLDVAQRYLGAEEHGQRQVLSRLIGNVGGGAVDPVTTPWCAGFINGVLRASGLQGSGSLAARSFLNVGSPVYGTPAEGDVVVFSRGDDPSKGHVAFYAGPGSTPGTVRVLGGNQGNKVGFAEYPVASIIGVRRMSKDDIGRTPQADIAMPQVQRGEAMRRILERKDLTPEQQSHAIAYIEQQARIQTVAAEQTAAARKEASDQAANGFVTRSLSGQPVDLNEIASDPHLTWEAKETLTRAIQARSGSDVERLQQTYGPGFWEAYKNVSAPADDPNRISDISQLLHRAGPGGDLTLAGVEKLNQVLGQNRKSVNDQAVNTSKVGLMNYAKGKLSFEQDTGPVKIRDPKGEAIFNGVFIPKFEAAFDKWVKGGKDPWEFLTKDNIDKLITGLRSPSEMAAAKLAALGADTPGKASPLPPAPSGIDAAAWSAVMSRRPVTENGTPLSPAAWGTAINMLLEHPTPTVIKQFNTSKFGRAGFDGEAIIRQLSQKTSPVTARPSQTGAPEIVPALATPETPAVQNFP